MSNDQDHGAHVDDWLERAVKGVAPPERLGAYHGAFSALWRRASLTLGDVTVIAIVDRVFTVAAEQFPALASVEVDVSGVRFDGLPAPGGAADQASIEVALRFVLVEFLTVLGNLTAEILSPALHAELVGHAQQAAADDGTSGDGTKP